MITLPSDPGTIDLLCCLHELNADEKRTCESIVRGAPGSTITPMPTHQIDEHGRLSGFTFSCLGHSPISALPLSRFSFHGHTACECEVSSADIIGLLSDVDKVRKTMNDFMVGLRDRCKKMPVATFACRPENVEGYVRDGAGAVSTIRTKRTVDSNEWVPEVLPFSY